MSSQSSKKILAEIYLPSVGKSSHDLKKRVQLLKNLNNLHTKTGLMLLILSEQDLEEEVIKTTLNNLRTLAKEQKELKVFIMHPNKPLSGKKRLNFLDNADWSIEYVKKSIDLCFLIQEEINSDWGKLLTFHLNTLVPPSLWRNDRSYWDQKFSEIYMHLMQLIKYADLKKVRLAIETTPIPEFGDIAKNKDTYLQDYKCFWSDLGNPWPLFFWRDEISKIKEAGFSIVIDWSHSYLALSTLKKLSRLPDREKVLNRYMIDQEDLEFAKSTKSFSDLINKNTKDGDIWHVNNAKGMYKYKDIFGTEEIFLEGVSLDMGEIEPEEISGLLESGLNKQIKIVIEVNETDFERSPNTRQTIEFISQFASDKFFQSNQQSS